MHIFSITISSKRNYKSVKLHVLYVYAGLFSMQDLSYKDKHWHEKCFKCCDCQKSLVDQPFASKNEKLYCADCHDNNFAARCDGCTDIFRAGQCFVIIWILVAHYGLIDAIVEFCKSLQNGRYRYILYKCRCKNRSFKEAILKYCLACTCMYK